MKCFLLAAFVLSSLQMASSEPQPLDRLASREGVRLGMSQSDVGKAMSGRIEHFDRLGGLWGQFLLVFQHYELPDSSLRVTYRTENWPSNLAKPDLRKASAWESLEQKRPYAKDLVVTTIDPAELCLDGATVVKVGEQLNLNQDAFSGKEIHQGELLGQYYWETPGATLWVTCDNDNVIQGISYVERMPEGRGQLWSESSRANEVNHK